MPNSFFNIITTAGTVDWVVVFSLVAFGVVYFLAPVLGYQSASRKMLTVSLFLLVGCGLLTILQAIVEYLVNLAQHDMGDIQRGILHVATIFAILRLIVFVAAQAAFVMGLLGLRRT